jgi:trigger factor
LNQDIRANMEREIQFALHARIRDKALEAIAAKNEFELPLAAIEFERQAMYRETLQRMGLKPEQLKSLPPLPENIYVDEAKKRIKFGLIVNHFIESEQLKASPEAIKARVTQLSSVYEKPEDVVKHYYDDPGRLKEVEFMVLEESAINHCISKCQITEKPVNFFDIIKPREPSAN